MTTNLNTASTTMLTISAMLMPRSMYALLGLLVTSLNAHGGHEQQPLAPDATWADKHMAEEHHISSYDAGSFFNLHDFDSNNVWTADEIFKSYGLHDASTNHISKSDKDAAVQKVIGLYDRDMSGTISFAEYTIGSAQGITLPDFGYGPGHHGDDEYEYEIHHFEKFHGPDATEEELTHPEDIEHFRHHDMLDDLQDKQDAMDKLSIVESNIPAKFRRGKELDDVEDEMKDMADDKAEPAKWTMKAEL
nr:putative calcium-binding protein [Quercus suber]